MRARRGVSSAAVAVLLIAGLSLAACGRMGPLEAPPGAVDEPLPTAVAVGTDGNPQPVPGAADPAEPERRFFLDFLL